MSDFGNQAKQGDSLIRGLNDNGSELGARCSVSGDCRAVLHAHGCPYYRPDEHRLPDAVLDLRRAIRRLKISLVMTVLELIGLVALIAWSRW